MTISLPQLKGADLLTHSRVRCFQTCQRKHYFRYELGIRRIGDSRPLRMGKAVHIGLDSRAQGGSRDEAILAACAAYEVLPDWANSDDLMREWMVERETVAALLAGYFWYWESRTDLSPEINPVEIIESERAFVHPIRNPETGATTPLFRNAGKRDRIVRLADGRVAVIEAKTTGDSVAVDSDYWVGLRVDDQISRYLNSAKDDGHQAVTVLYDVLHKPGIKPTNIPLLDGDGTKIVLDAAGERVRTKDGKKWRETGDTALGYVLQTRPETAEEYGKRLLADITERPDFYYARREIPRLQADLDDFALSLWQRQQQIRDAQRNGRWFRNSDACTAMGRCEYIDICHNCAPLDPLPAGFERVQDIHPELTEE